MFLTDKELQISSEYSLRIMKIFNDGEFTILAVKSSLLPVEGPTKQIFTHDLTKRMTYCKTSDEARRCPAVIQQLKKT